MFTYATPHNGIDLRIVRNVPGWAALGDATNFNRDRMAKYLALPVDTNDVSEVRNFPSERIFNLIGTDPADYLVLRGLSSWAVGEASDGLVRVANAATYGFESGTGRRIESPRAFAHRSHSGHYGIVNSEEGYQNLTRFLFGSVRIDGILNVDNVMLPAEIQEHLIRGIRFEGLTISRSLQPFAEVSGSCTAGPSEKIPPFREPTTSSFRRVQMGSAAPTWRRAHICFRYSWIAQRA